MFSLQGQITVGVGACNHPCCRPCAAGSSGALCLGRMLETPSAEAVGRVALYSPGTKLGTIK